MAYAWGSRGGIAALQGRGPSGGPEAELWMGAHPQAASVLEHGGRLDALVEAAPARVLGAEVVARFGVRLPFMLKVLSAAEPLSLQVHPDDALARERFDGEEATGIDRGAPDRSYRDPYAKPEMLVAITDFQVLLGFRPAVEAADALHRLGIQALSGVASALRGGAPTGEAFLTIVDWPVARRRELVAEVRAGAVTSDDPRAPWLVFLADRYPDDPGVAGVVLLNYVRLHDGQGVYVAPGQIHAYLQGTGVEILGGSDNVVRGGLTPKHVAVGELRRVLSCEAVPPSIIEPVACGDGEEMWITPRPEFALSRLRLDDSTREFAVSQPQILLCIEGKVEVGAADVRVVLGGGESAFVTADTGPVTASGRGVLLRATPGRTVALERPATRSEA